MSARFYLRLFLGVVYLAVLFSGAGFLYNRLQRFEGEIGIALNGSEHTVVRPSKPGGWMTGLDRNMPAEVISFSNTNACRRWLGDDDLFDAVRLPYQLKYDSVEVLTPSTLRDVLLVGEMKHPLEIAAAADVPFPLPDGEGRILGIRPWAGLLRNAKGQPMALVSFRTLPAPWTECVFLENNSWLYVGEDTAILLRWFQDEASAKKYFPDDLASLKPQRWGVTEGKRIHWFDNFNMGTGIELDDGSEYTLMEFAPEHVFSTGAAPGILVERKKDGKSEQSWFRPNVRDESIPIRFDYPTRMKTVVYLNAWDEGRVLLRVYHDGKGFEAATLEENGCWRPEEAEAASFSFEFRLEQAMREALPVPKQGAPVLEALVQCGDTVLRIREGAMERFGATQVRYRRLPTAPVVACTFSALEKDTAPKTFHLAPGEERRCENWAFSLDEANANAEKFAVLHARRIPFTPETILGAAIFMLGALGLMALRYWRMDTSRRERIEAPEMGEEKKEEWE